MAATKPPSATAATSAAASAPASTPASAASTPAFLNEDLSWKLYDNPQMAEAAAADPATFKNVAYFHPSPSAKNYISDFFWGKTAFEVTLAAGSYLYRFNDKVSLDVYPGGAVTGWWTPYFPHDVDPGFIERLKMSRMMGVTFKEWGRVTSAISEDWGALTYVLVAKTKVPMKVFFGGFAAVDRIQGGASKRVPFDASSGVRLLSVREVQALKEACTVTDPTMRKGFWLSDAERDFLLAQWRTLWSTKAITTPTPEDLKQPAPPAWSGPVRTAVPEPAAPQTASITRGPPTGQTGEAAAGRRLPGGGRQFYIPNLKEVHIEVAYSRDIAVEPAKGEDVVRWWREPDAAGRRAP